jgi:hypothetical protein
MPTKKIDHAAVLAAFEELKNGRAVSRALGIHRNTVYSILRRFSGECLRCKAPVSPGMTSCQKCREWDNQRIRKERKLRRRLGICQRCDQPRSHLSSRHCEQHRIEDLEWREKHPRKRYQKRGTPNPSASDPETRLRSIAENYGQAGIERWKTDEAKCQICSSLYDEVSVHLHHIDQDPKNNTFENLACLCFYCHQAVHKLISTKSLRKLLAWLGEKYPQKMEE